MGSIYVNVDIDVDDIIGDIDTEDLKNELESRGETFSNYEESPLCQTITRLAGMPEFSLSDKEVCDIVLKELGRI